MIGSVDNIIGRLKEKVGPYADKLKEYAELAKGLAVSIARDAAIKVASSELGRAAIDSKVKSFLGDKETRNEATEYVAEELREVKKEVQTKTEPFLKEAAVKMGVTEAPGYKQIYETIANRNDFFLLKPVKGLFAVLLSGGMNAASYVTALAANKILGTEKDDKITAGTVKAVFVGLFKKAFGAALGGFNLLRTKLPATA